MERLPDNTNRRTWRACIRCAIIKTRDQFQREGCDNCEEVLGVRDNVGKFTTAQFDGMIAMMEPGASWVAKWQRCDKYVPGMYAIRVTGKKPPNWRPDSP
ncbi:Transcription elongation factor SPT4 [Irineochytrium annulatum]|nr:Transcription elongation factor SPT4 [Irineochytrium annulatum]